MIFNNNKNFNFAAALVMVATIISLSAGYVVEENGKLKILNNKIVNKNNQPVSFAGPSLFWSNTNWQGEKFYNKESVKHMKQEWKATITRAAMGVETDGGYIADAGVNKGRVEAVVDAAIEEDMYVIIDWHTHHAELHTDKAMEFFQEMAKKYNKYNNIIYEIYNEPLDVSWSGVIKPYAEAVIEKIRQFDSDNLIIVGTPSWSQKVDEASVDPITKYNNIAYTLHFYAGTHKKWLRDRAEKAMEKIPLFVTEWGAVDASGNGDVHKEETLKWIDFLNEHHVSHCMWSLNDKTEGASFLDCDDPSVIKDNVARDCPSRTPISARSLTQSGTLMKEILTNPNYPSTPKGDGKGNGKGDGSGVCNMHIITLATTFVALLSQNIV
eukprot:Pgem_evm1s19357